MRGVQIVSADTIRIAEIFGPTIQGEGALIGQPTVFVRTGGCDYRCRWCDTPYAVDSTFRRTWRPLGAEEIMARVEELSGGKPILVSLSGGNPALQPLGDVIALGHEKGYRFALETQGSVARDWFSSLDVLTLSPKPPSSAMETNWNKFEDCLRAAADGPAINLKIVIFDEADYAYAREAAARYPDLPLYLQPGNHAVEGPAETGALNTRLRWLAERVTNDNWFAPTILPQLHVMAWGNKKGV